MHTLILQFHSLLRWLILIAGFITFFQAAGGLFGKRPWTGSTRRPGQIFNALLDLQLILGLLLAFALPRPTHRFFKMEHLGMMILALILAHTGGILVKRVTSGQRKFKRTVIFYGLALLLILLAIPWPFMPAYGRPWVF